MDSIEFVNGKGDAVFAPPNTSRTVPLDFLIPTGPVPPGGFFDLAIRGFAAGSATAVPEPSALTLSVVGLLSLAAFAVCRLRRSPDTLRSSVELSTIWEAQN